MKLVDTNRRFISAQRWLDGKLLKSTNEFLHLATVKDNNRAYVCIYMPENHSIFIEEAVGKGMLDKHTLTECMELKWIPDNIFGEVYEFLLASNALKEPFLPDQL